MTSKKDKSNLEGGSGGVDAGQGEGGGPAVRPYRELYDVLGLMLQHVPRENDLYMRLKSIRDRVVYTPPECRVPLWRMSAVVLHAELGEPPLSGWAAKVRKIWAGEDPGPVEGGN